MRGLESADQGAGNLERLPAAMNIARECPLSQVDLIWDCCSKKNCDAAHYTRDNSHLTSLKAALASRSAKVRGVEFIWAWRLLGPPGRLGLCLH